jgi:hypothetical protein
VSTKPLNALASRVLERMSHSHEHVSVTLYADAAEQLRKRLESDGELPVTIRDRDGSVLFMGMVSLDGWGQFVVRDPMAALYGIAAQRMEIYTSPSYSPEWCARRAVVDVLARRLAQLEATQ